MAVSAVSPRLVYRRHHHHHRPRLQYRISPALVLPLLLHELRLHDSGSSVGWSTDGGPLANARLRPRLLLLLSPLTLTLCSEGRSHIASVPHLCS